MTTVYFQAKITVEERVAWTWCLFFAFLVPEIGKPDGVKTIVRPTDIRKNIFGGYQRPVLKSHLSGKDVFTRI